MHAGSSSGPLTHDAMMMSAMTGSDVWATGVRAASSAFDQNQEGRRAKRARYEPADRLFADGLDGDDRDDAMARAHIVRRVGDRTTPAEELYIVEECRRRHKAGEDYMKVVVGAEVDGTMKPRPCTGQVGATSVRRRRKVEGLASEATVGPRPCGRWESQRWSDSAVA